MAKLAFPEGYTFRGFEMPQYTPVPDVVFDYFLARLNGSELKVLLYIIRRTLGFKKPRDDISLQQLVNGITTRDGRVLDEGTGLSMPSVVRAVQSLVDKEIIIARRNSSPERGHEATTYALNFRGGAGDWNSFRRGDDGEPDPDDDDPLDDVHPDTDDAANYDAEGDEYEYDDEQAEDGDEDDYDKEESEGEGGDPYLNNLSRGTKKTLVGLLKKVKTQETVVQETEEQQSVVVALAQRGVHERAAEQLALSYPLERIWEKVGVHDWLEVHSPNALSRNPAGWLVRAIEEDWPAPRGYNGGSEDASEAEYTTGVGQGDDWFAAEGDDQLTQLPLEPVPEPDPDPPPDAPPEVITWWEEAYQSLELQLPRETFNTWLRDACLLEGWQDDSRAEMCIGVQNIYARDWLEDRLRKPIVRELSRIAGRDVAVTFALREGG